MRYRTARPLPLLFGIIIGSLLCACSNSDGVDYANYAENTTNSEEYWNTKVDYLPLDDSEYPYAGIPRIIKKLKIAKQKFPPNYKSGVKKLLKAK